MVDLDKDGLLDIVSGERNGTVKFYKNTGTKTVPSFNNTPTIDSLGKVHSRELFTAVGISSMLDLVGYSAPHIYDADNDGVYDMLLGSNYGKVKLYSGVYANKDSVAKEVVNPYIDYSMEANLGYNKKFGMRSTPTTAFLNGDSLPDIMIGSISGGLTFLGSSVSPINSIDERFIDNNAFVLYPNPTDKVVNLMFSRAVKSEVHYAIFDMSGKKIMAGILDQNQTNTNIQVDELNSGLYLIQLTTNQWQSTQRLIINK